MINVTVIFAVDLEQAGCVELCMETWPCSSAPLGLVLIHWHESKSWCEFGEAEGSREAAAKA